MEPKINGWANILLNLVVACPELVRVALEVNSIEVRLKSVFKTL